MLKLKLQYFGHLVRRVDSLEKTLMLGGIGGRRRRGRQRMKWLDGITDLMDLSLSELRSWWWTGRPGVLRFMGSQRVGHNWATELNWKEGEGTVNDHWKEYFCWGWGKCSRIRSWLHNSESILKPNKLYTLRWWIISQLKINRKRILK